MADMTYADVIAKFRADGVYLSAVKGRIAIDADGDQLEDGSYREFVEAHEAALFRELAREVREAERIQDRFVAQTTPESSPLRKALAEALVTRPILSDREVDRQWSRATDNLKRAALKRGMATCRERMTKAQRDGDVAALKRDAVAYLAGVLYDRLLTAKARAR